MNLRNPPRVLPKPSAEEIQESAKLVRQICEAIDIAGGKISFARFMEMALYTPDLGYYVSSKAIFGEQGDFITAPELTPMFSRCIARQVQEVLSNMENGGDVIEFGAGAGTMACDILMELNKLNSLPHHYYIAEISPTLRQRQRTRIATYAPQLLEKVSWVEDMPDGFCGVVLGNEILDAIPTHRVRLRQNGNHDEMFVTHRDNAFYWHYDEPSCSELQDASNTIFQRYGCQMTDHYETEVNLNALNWIKNISCSFEKGLILLIDYGFSENEFFRPERYEGSLMCHYKHCAHSDALTHVGLQDITSHVNFSDVATTAHNNGLDVRGFTNQTYFLISCGLESLLNEIDISDTKQFLHETQPVKQLILPDEMGELFKVIGLTKNYSQELLGFQLKNQLERL